MKALVQVFLQKLLGFRRYLWIFTRYKLHRLHKDSSEKDFFHFLDLIPNGGIVLDIGANLGLMSFYLARSEKVKQVHAFEPLPQNLQNLQRLKTHYGLSKLFVHPVALGKKNGEIDMVLPVVKGVKKQGLGHVIDQKMEVFNDGIRLKVPCYKLDDYPQLDSVTVNAIKIDVENFEYEVFLGAQSILAQNKPLIYCELWDNKNRYDCFDLLRSIGYGIMYLDKGALKPFEGSKSKTQNFFFIHSHP